MNNSLYIRVNNSPDLDVVSQILELELKTDSLSATIDSLNRTIKSKDLSLGKINAEKKKLESLNSSLREKIDYLEANYNTKNLFSKGVASLIEILKKSRMVSQNHEERKSLEELILILNKSNDNG